MIGTQIDDRRWYGRFDKKEILAKTNGICACCGKKLTIETMTIEHVIPINRGGLDGPGNTIALCEACNKMKGNTLYIPTWFYSAIIGTKLLDELNEKFTRWFQTVKQDFDINMFPLIAPRHNLILDIGSISNCSSKYMKRVNTQFMKSSIIQWHYTGKQYMDEVQEATGVDLWGMRHMIENIMPTYRPPVALYTCRKLTTDKILCLAGISMYLEQKTALIAIEWNNMSNKFKSAIWFSLVRLLFNVMYLGQYDLDDVILLVPFEDGDILETVRCDQYMNILAYDGHVDEISHRIIDTGKYQLQDHYAGLEIKIGKTDVQDIFPKI